MLAMRLWGNIMREDIFFPSCGKGNIHVCRWIPEGQVKGVVQIVHGIAEYALRYESFALYLNSLGYGMVAEDHMGHGQSIGEDTVQGYFHGGWFAAVEDTMTLMKTTMVQYPELPYVLFGHSMGSFMARTILAKYPDCGITACVICGTAWQSPALISAVLPLTKTVCKLDGETVPSPKLQNLVFGAYNKRIKNPRTGFDWISRDAEMVDKYVADPLCGFVATGGLLRDMMTGLAYIHKSSSLAHMDKELPVLFAAGETDPVGDYGKGVLKAAKRFREAGMRHVSVKLYPGCRHEILNETNREKIYRELGQWILNPKE